MKIKSLHAKCIYCNRQINSEETYHLKCKSEVDQYQSIYGLKNPWIQYWIYLLVNNLHIEFNDLNLKYMFSIQDLITEIKEFTRYNKGSGLIFENLCFVKISMPTWIILKGTTAVDADNYQDWPENDF